MPEPYVWKHSIVDVIANRYGVAVEEYLLWVVKPSLAALEIRRQELAAGDDPHLRFEHHHHIHLTKRAAKAFCLGIHSLFEQQLRTYLDGCAFGYTIEGVTQRELEVAPWGERMNALFLRVRGISLEDFDSYRVLTQLQMLGNACRHGDGDSSRKLYHAHPTLWPMVSLGVKDESAPPFEFAQITSEHLTRYVAAISLFWMDMQRLGVESLEDVPAAHVASLLEKRVPLLAAIAS